MVLLAQVYCKHYGQAIRGVAWDTYPLAFLQVVAVGLGGPALARILAALALDSAHLSGGLPDLLLWRVLVPLDMPGVEVAQQESHGEGGLPNCRRPLPEAARLLRHAGPGGGQAHRDELRWPSDVPLSAPPCLWELLPSHLSEILVEVRLSEVKGPRDVLSDTQRAWLSILAEAGVQVEVCRVKEPKPTKRRRTGRKVGAGRMP